MNSEVASIRYLRTRATIRPIAPSVSWPQRLRIQLEIVDDGDLDPVVGARLGPQHGDPGVRAPELLGLRLGVHNEDRVTHLVVGRGEPGHAPPELVHRRWT